MKCPLCNVDLVMSERQGIEIDYCPECRGVWLDRGELDKIIERSAQSTQGRDYDARRDDRRDYERRYPERKERGRDRYYDHDDYDHGYRKEQEYKKHKKKRGGFLEDLFEFGD